MALNAFSTPNFGPIGIVDNNRVMFYRNNPESAHMKIKSVEKDVAIIKCSAGSDSRFIDFSIEQGYKGIIIEALGRGNVPPAMVEGIKRAIDKNIPVIVVSRCFEGRVFESYGYEGGGKTLRNMGVIFGDDLCGQKARIKLMLALGKSKDLDMIKEIFEEGRY